MGDKDYPPYESLVDGEPIGINVDLWREIAKILGRPLDFRLYQWADSQARVRRGEAKVLTFMSFNNERNKLYDFTKPTFTSRFPIFVPAEIADKFDISDLTGKRIAVKKGGFPRTIIETIHPEAEMVFVDSALEGFRKLLRGEVDGVMEDERVGYTILNENAFHGIRATPKALAVKTGHIAVAKGNPALLRQIDEALGAIKASGKFDQIADKWAGLDTVLIKRETIRFVIVSSLAAIVLILGLGGVVYVLKVRRANLALQEEITERKEAEKDVSRLAAAIEGLSENFALYGPDDRLVMCNQGYSQLNEAVPEATRPGVSYEEHMRAVVAKGLAPKAMGREEDYIRERMELHRNPTEPYEVVRQGRVWLVHEQHVADGSTAIIATDITERKQAEEDLGNALIEAKQANQAKSEFLATMSHELRTPLNAILGFADIINHQYFGPTSEKYKEYAEDIQSSGEHLLTLINEILDLSTIEAGKQPLVNEKLSIKEIVGECKKIVEEKARSSGVDLVVKVPKDLPPLYADRRAFKQILLNLLSNAVKFTSEGGKITVSAKASKRNMTLKIADTGKGIPAEKLPKLTDPFTRVDGDPYMAEPGWGLGLSITKSLVDLHDGTLDIKSKVGKGTTVTVTLPNGTP
ncbi:MAG: transporter substrate-binding domain-containing protein [Proteobacteria bacterium]|nr:transporter substrate-binding domain-containing protein [Pseudomonadota bacterium]